MTLLLSRSEILRLLDMGEVIEAVEGAHRDLATGAAVMPDRTVMPVPDGATLVVPMAAAVGADRGAGIKVLTDTPANAAYGRPVQQSMIALVEPETGAFQAVLHGAAITLFRTAAASAVATRHLANPDGDTLGLVGAGAQARAHLEAVRRVRTVRRVLVWSRTRATTQAFVDDVTGTGVDVLPLDSAEAVVRGSDVVCTLTPSREAHVKGAWFHDGQHVNAVGAPPRADHREIDTEGILRSRVVLDSRAVAMAESGEILVPLAAGDLAPDQVRVELGEVIAGLAPGRRSATEVTLFNSIGLGIQDMVTARLVLEKARSKGLGLEVDLTR